MAPSITAWRHRHGTTNRDPNLLRLLLAILEFSNVFHITLSALRRRRLLHRVLYNNILAAVPHLAGVMQQSAVSSPRSFWINPRSGNNWFISTVIPLWSDSLWVQSFRMTRQTFFELVDSIRPHLLRNDTHMRLAISPEERTAIAIFFLASKCCYRAIGLLFSRGTSTVCEIVIEFCLVLERYLLHGEVRLRDFTKAAAGFASMGLPSTFGELDGSHIPIRAPKHQAHLYINRKGFYSVVLQAACDADGYFFSSMAGFAGVSHDSHIFRCSSLYSAMEENRFVPGNPTLRFGDVVIPPLILGDAAYPLKPWLRKPYPVPRTAIQCNYNAVFNKCRNVVERAFGRLKARFRRLSVRCDVEIQNITSVVSAAVVLHNICERKNHQIPAVDEEEINTQCVTNSALDAIDPGDPDEQQENRVHAEHIRDALAEYIYLSANA